MISIRFEKDADRIVALTVKGHSGYAEAGKDIVCAAVSAVAQTALLGIADISKNVRSEIREKSGFLRFVAPKESGERELRQQAILRAAELGLRDICASYGSCARMEEE